GVACPPGGARRTPAAWQSRVAPAARARAPLVSGACPTGRSPADRPEAAHGLDPERGAADPVSRDARGTGRGGTRPLARRGCRLGTRAVRPHGTDAPCVARGDPRLLAPPHHQRPRRGQTQPRESAETEGVRLPERTRLSVQDPQPNPHSLM